MVAHDVRDKLKIYYYYIMSPEKTSKYIFEKAVKGGSFTYPFIQLASYTNINIFKHGADKSSSMECFCLCFWKGKYLHQTNSAQLLNFYHNETIYIILHLPGDPVTLYRKLHIVCKRISILTRSFLNMSGTSTIIRSLYPNKAHGDDGISIRMLKFCASSVSKPLFLLFKHSLENE